MISRALLASLCSLVVLGVGLAPLACGGGDKAQRPSASAQQAEARLHAGPPKPWDEMSFDERADYMKTTVVPAMKPIFEAFDADFFADFGCASCHGDAAEAGTFEMPNPDIMALPETGTPEQKQMVADSPEWLKFMIGKVYPNVRDLLGKPNWDNETKTGFSCFGCHTKGATLAP